jgi:hypothetical protein
MSRRDDVYNPPPEPEPEPRFRCFRCHAPTEVIMGNVVTHDCPALKKVRYIPPKYERTPRDWMA